MSWEQLKTGSSLFSCVQKSFLLVLTLAVFIFAQDEGSTVITEPSAGTVQIDYTAPSTYSDGYIYYCYSVNDPGMTPPGGGNCYDINGTRSYTINGLNDNDVIRFYYKVNMSPELVTSLQSYIVGGISTWDLTVNATAGGTTTPSGIQSLDSGETLALTATAAGGFRFTGWSIPIGILTHNGLTNAAISVSMHNGDATLQANFVQVDTIVLSHDGNGTTVPVSSVIGDRGTSFQISAIPNTGYRFREWIIVSGNSTLSNAQISNPFIAFNGNSEIQATFELIPTYTVTAVVTEGDGVVSPDSGIATENVNYNLVATPDYGWAFDHWEYNNTEVLFFSSTLLTNINLQATSDTEVQAFFTKIDTLTLTDDGNGYTNPASSVTGKRGTTRTIYAFPNSGYRFKEWQIISGDSTLSNPQIYNPVITFSGDAEVHAVFEALPTYLVTTSVGGGNGSVSPDSGIATEGVNYYIRATPDSGWIFDHWEYVAKDVNFFSNTNTAAPYLRAVNNTDIVAFFKPRYTFTTSSAGNGTITPWYVNTLLDSGQIITPSTVAEPGYEFSNWETVFGTVEYTDSLDGSANYSVHSDAEIQGHFKKNYQPCSTPFFDGFEADTLNQCWLKWEGNSSYVTVEKQVGYAYEDSSSMVMHASSSNRLNEMILSVNLLNDSNVLFEFWQDEVDMVNSNPLFNGQHSIDHSNGNGVSVSVDSGQTWYTVAYYAYGEPFTFYRIDLDSVIADHGLMYSEDVQFKFSQYASNWYSYLYIDNVKVYSPQFHSLESRTDGNGSVVLPSASPFSVFELDTIEVEAAADSGYKFFKWVVVNGSVWLEDSTSERTQVQVSSDAVIEAQFMEASQLIISRSGEGGVAPADTVLVFTDSTIGISATPARAHTFSTWSVLSGSVTIADPFLKTAEATVGSDGEIQAVFTPKNIYDITDQDTTHYGFYTHGHSSQEGALEGVYFKMVGDGSPLKLTITEKSGVNWTKEINFIGKDSLSPINTKSASSQTGVTEFWTPVLDAGDTYYLQVLTNDTLNLNNQFSIKYEKGGTLIVLSKYGHAEPDSTLYLLNNEQVMVSAIPNSGFDFTHWSVETGTITYLNGTFTDKIITIQADSLPIILKANYSLTSGADPIITLSEPDISGHPRICITAQVRDTTENYFFEGLDSSNFDVWQDNRDGSVIVNDTNFVYPIDVSSELLGINVALVVDESGSMSGKIADARDAVHGFIDGMGEYDKTAIVGFTGDQVGTVHSELTSDTTVLHDVTDDLDATGGTDMIDGTFAGLEVLKDAVGPKTLVVFTDGNIGTNSHTILEVLDTALKYNVTVYAIGVQSIIDGSVDVLTDSTGGQLIENVRSTDLGNVYEAIRNDVMSQYRICYISPDKVIDGDTNDVVIEVNLFTETDVDTTFWTEDNHPPVITLTDSTLALFGQNLPGGKAIRISAVVTDDVQVDNVTMSYKTTGANTFIDIPMVRTVGDTFTALIPAVSAQFPGVDFYIIARDNEQLNGKSPNVQFPWVTPHHLIVDNSVPQLILNRDECFELAETSFTLSGKAFDDDGTTTLVYYYKGPGEPFYTVDTLVVAQDSGFSITTNVSAEDVIQYYFEAIDNWGGVSRAPTVGEYIMSSCNRLADPEALMLPDLDPLDSLFRDSVYIRLKSSSDNIIDDIRIYYTTDPLRTLDLKSDYVISGDSVLIKATSYFRIFAYHTDPTIHSSDTAYANFYKQYKLATPFLERLDNIAIADSLFIDSLRLVVRSADSLVENLRIFYSIDGSIPDSSKYWEANDTIVIYDSTSFIFFAEAPLLFNSDTVYQNYHEVDASAFVKLYDENKQDIGASLTISGSNDSLFIRLDGENLFSDADSIAFDVVAIEKDSLFVDRESLYLLYDSTSQDWVGVIHLNNSMTVFDADSVISWYRDAELSFIVSTKNFEGLRDGALTIVKNIRMDNADAELIVKDGYNTDLDVSRLSDSILVHIIDQSLSFTIDSVFVTAACLKSGDVESDLRLIETDSTSGQYYIDSLLVKNETTPFTAENKELQCFYNDTLVVTYVDSIWNEVVTDTTIFAVDTSVSIHFITGTDSIEVLHELHNVISDSVRIRVNYFDVNLYQKDSLFAQLWNDQGDSLRVVLVETDQNSGIYEAFVTVEFWKSLHNVDDDVLSSKLDYSSPGNQSEVIASLIGFDSVSTDLLLFPAAKKLLSAIMKDGDRSGYGDTVLLHFSGNVLYLPESLNELFWNRVDDDFSITTDKSMFSYYAGSNKSIDSSTIVVDLSSIQNEVRGTDIPVGETPYAQLPEDHFFGAQSAPLEDKVSPLLQSVLKIPSAILESDDFSGRANDIDTMIFIFSEPVEFESTGNLPSLWMKQFRQSPNCDENHYPITVNSVQPFDTLGYEFKAALQGDVTEVGGCIVVNEFEELIKDSLENPIAIHKTVVNGLDRNVQTRVSIINVLAGVDEPRDRATWIPAGKDAPVELTEGISILSIISKEKYTATIHIFSAIGQYVTTINNQFGYAGEFEHGNRATKSGFINHIPWNLRDINGRKVGSGVYIWKVNIQFESGKRESFILKSGVIGVR